MKSLIHFVCIAVLFTACTDKEELDGNCIGIIDFIGPPSFQLKFIDNNENNLIENGYFDSDLISASINSQSFSGQITDFDGEGLQNIVILPSGIGNEGKNTWLLKLSEDETDTLEYSLVYTEVRQGRGGNGFFCGTMSSVETALYNGNPIDLEASIIEGSYNYSLVINKTLE